MSLMMFKQRIVEVIETFGSLTKIDDNGNIFSVKTTSLKAMPTKRTTDMQKALTCDPDAVALLVPQVETILVYCNPDAVDKTAHDISSNSALSEIDAVDYISDKGELSHGAKFEIHTNGNMDPELVARLGVFFDAKLDRICSKNLALWLMREHGILPRRMK